MRRSNTAIQHSADLENALWQSSDDDAELGSAVAAATLPTPRSARRLSDSTGPAAPVPLPRQPMQSFTSVRPGAAMAVPQSNRRVDLARVVLPSNLNGVVSAARVPAMARQLVALNQTAIRSPAQLAMTAHSHVPQLSAVDRPSSNAERRSCTVDRPPAHAATTRHRSAPYQLVRGHQLAAPVESTLDPTDEYMHDWRPFRVHFHRDKLWWTWDHGIIDLRAMFHTKDTALAGTQLSVGFTACRWVLRRCVCEFKVGMARRLGARWELYQSSPETWTPTHLFIVLHVRGREAVGWAEAGLIALLCACGDVDVFLNINHRNNDKGGNGPRHDCELGDWFWVYLATNIG